MEALTRDLTWGSERVSLAELRERHPSLPAVVKVVHGYCGETDADSLSNEQVLIIHMWIKQGRVAAENHTGRIISIPINARQLFDLHPPNTGTSEGLLISSLLKTHTLPIEVTFNPQSRTSFSISGQTHRSDKFGKLTLLSSHKITYAIASTLTEGDLEVDDLFAVPTYRRVDLVVPSSLSGHQRALLQDHTCKVSHLLDRYVENPSGHEFNCLPSVGIVDYGEILGGDPKSQCTGGTSKEPMPSTSHEVMAHDIKEDHDVSGDNGKTLSDAVTRFTHYQQLLSSSSPDTKRKAANRAKSSAKEEPPKKLIFGPQPPRTPPKCGDKSLAESIKMLQGLGTKLADKPQSTSPKVEGLPKDKSENNESRPNSNGAEAHGISDEDSVASTHF